MGRSLGWGIACQGKSAAARCGRRWRSAAPSWKKLWNSASLPSPMRWTPTRSTGKAFAPRSRPRSTTRSPRSRPGRSGRRRLRPRCWRRRGWPRASGAGSTTCCAATLRGMRRSVIFSSRKSTKACWKAPCCDRCCGGTWWCSTACSWRSVRNSRARAGTGLPRPSSAGPTASNVYWRASHSTSLISATSSTTSTPAWWRSDRRSPTRSARSRRHSTGVS